MEDKKIVVLIICFSILVFTLGAGDASGQNQPPTAIIDSIMPNPADLGQEVFFAGHGEDTDGSIIAYHWRSHLAGQLSTDSSFSTSALSAGIHAIYFKVQDDDSVWSEEDVDTLQIEAEYILATVDIDPNSLNLRSRGKWITCYIELPNGYDVNDIDVTTVLFNDSLHAEPRPYGVGDYDDDGVADLMVKFNRAEAGNLLAPGDSVEMRVSGEITGEMFAGTDTIRVFMPGHDAERPTQVRKLRVNQNYPNPVNPFTKISFSIPKASDVKLEIYNVLGQRVRTLVDERLEPGEHLIEWNGRGADEQPLAAGIYFYRLTANGLTETKKMLLLK